MQRLDSNPRWRGILDLDEAGPRAVSAYFRTYGPATIDNLHYWLGDGLSADASGSIPGSKGSAIGWSRSTSRGAWRTVAREDVDVLEATHPSEALRFLPGHDQW